MKKIILSICFITAALLSTFAQNKKAVRDSIAQVKFQKVVAAIEEKDFVIIVDTYVKEVGKVDSNGDKTIVKEGGIEESTTDKANAKDGVIVESNTDRANFLSYEKDFVILQGIPAGNSYTNKLTVSEYSQVADKKGNIRITMHGRGNFIVGKIEISVKKGFPADVIITPTKGNNIRFSGEVVPRRESKYFKRSGEI
jgi:hypothetical protein